MLWPQLCCLPTCLLLVPTRLLVPQSWHLKGRGARCNVEAGVAPSLAGRDAGTEELSGWEESVMTRHCGRRGGQARRRAEAAPGTVRFQAGPACSAHDGREETNVTGSEGHTRAYAEENLSWECFIHASILKGLLRLAFKIFLKDG